MKKETKAIKNKIIRDIRILEHEKVDYYKPVSISSLWSKNYIEYESNGERIKKLSLKEYLNKIRPYFKNIIINLKTSDTWKIQLAIAINFTSSKDNDEERVMYSESYNLQSSTKYLTKTVVFMWNSTLRDIF